MINTIFYYPQTLTFEEYLNQLGSEIAARTIVFAKDQKSIYMGGKKFGASSASDISDLKQYIENVLEDNSVTNKIEEIINNYYNTTPQDLPTASTTKKGCIKVGSGLVMGNDEKLNVDFSTLPSGQNGIDGLDGLVEQIIRTDTSTRASYTNFGVVKVGSGITCESGVISVELTKGDKGDTGPQGAQGPQGERGPAGPAYDDSALQHQIDLLDQAIQDVSDTADAEKDRLDGLIDDLDGEISGRIDAMFEDAQWVQEHVANQIVSESNFGESDVEAYLQRIGVWEQNEEHTAQLTKWSKLAQTVNTLSGSVNQLLTQGIDEQALQAQIELKISDGIANLDLSTIYARKQAETVIEWLYSGLKGQANDTTTFADLVSAGKNSLHQAIADIHTYVQKLANGDYVATASLEASVDSAIAGLKASASSNTAKTEIFNKISQNSTDIAAIVSSITNDNSQTTIANKIGTWRSGLITQANLDSAIASLLATNGTYTAGIMTEAEFNAAKTSLVAKNEYDAATIVAMINNAGSLVEINADKINLNGNTFVDAIFANINSRYGLSIDASGLYVRAGGGIGQGSYTEVAPGSITVSATNQLSGAHTTLGAYGLEISQNNSAVTLGVNSGNLTINSDTEISGTAYVNDVVFGTTDNVTLSAWFDRVEGYVNDGDFVVDTLTVGSGGNSYTFSYNSTDSVAALNSGLDVDGHLSVDGTIYATGPVNANSDERIKENIVPVSVDIEDIAKARIVDFNFKGKEETHFGSIAQDWQNIFSNAVEEDKDGILSMNYGAIALGSAVTAAREIVELKKKNAELEARLAALEAKLG